MYIAVDFDGTVVDHDYPYMGEPVPGAIEWMQAWAKQGAKIMLHTMRDGEELIEAIEYLEENGVPLYGVNVNPDQVDWTDSSKTFAHVYVDDLAYGVPLHKPEGFKNDCVNWHEVGPKIYARILGVDNAVH